MYATYNYQEFSNYLETFGCNVITAIRSKIGKKLLRKQKKVRIEF